MLNSNTPDSVRAEAALFARYLVASAVPGEALAERYRHGCGVLFPQASDADVRVVALALRRPWLLGPLDAAAALLRPGSLLRRKILLMTALVETTPEHAAAFVPESAGVLRLALLGLSAGFKTAIRLPIGAVAIWMAERRR
jgi:hypothetical protein